MHSSGGSTSGTGETADNCETTDDGGAAATDSVDNNSREKAIAYLNSKNVWCSDSIAKYPSLTGLFEALNEYKFNDLVDKWSKELQDVPYFSRVVQAANNAISGKWNAGQGLHAPHYNKDYDKLINLDNYTDWISKDQTPKPAPVKQQAPVNHIKPDAPVKQQKPVNHIKQDPKPDAKPAPTTRVNNNDTKKKRGKVK